MNLVDALKQIQENENYVVFDNDARLLNTMLLFANELSDRLQDQYVKMLEKDIDDLKKRAKEVLGKEELKN